MTMMYLLVMFLSLWIMIARDLKLVKYTGRIFVLILILSIFVKIKLSLLFFITLIYVGIAIYAFIKEGPKYLSGTQTRNRFKKWFMHPLEFIGLSIFNFIFSSLPLEWSSWTLGKLAEIFGPMTRGEKTIKMNLDYIKPEWNTPEFRKKIWNDWGRSFAEGLFIDYYAKHEDKYITYKNKNLLNKMQELPVFMTALMHYGTMGIMALPFSKLPLITGIVYRFPNNPLSDKILRKTFGEGVAPVEYISKGQPRQILERLKKGGNVAISPDLRIKEGEDLTFFGKPAQTSTGIVKMAILFKIPIVLCYVHRTHGVHHEIVTEAIVNPIPAKTREESEKKTMQHINDLMEKIIKKDPVQWFWMHTRWGKNLCNKKH